MRGKERDRSGRQSHHRITPAYAGKSASRPHVQVGLRDHPRLCGEKDSWDIDFLRDLGSPPPMRGKDSFSDAELARERITPAYAGKSQIRLGLTS